MDQVFAVRQVCEKYPANGTDVFRAFINLEKTYDWRVFMSIVGRVSGWEMM